MTDLPAKLQPYAPALNAALEKLAALDDDGLLAAPVDLAFMLRHGLELHESLKGKTWELDQRTCAVVSGDVEVDTLVLRREGSLLVLGALKARSAELHGTVLVLGACDISESIVGHGEPHTLTVLGETRAGRCEMHRQFIMQFLGSGKLASLSDSEGSAEELLELLRGAGSELEIDEVDG